MDANPINFDASADNIKDENFKILTTQGKQPDLEETYICDKCDKTLKINNCSIVVKK